MKESQPIFSFFDASYSRNHPLPSFNLHSQADCDYIEVGLCEGESNELIVMKEGLVESVFFRK